MNDHHLPDLGSGDLDEALARARVPGAVDQSDNTWFQRAVFYEVLLRTYRDLDGDGLGDIAGLTAKLDYLQWLGVDCLWLLPFFPSPLRDGGYDVSDFCGVHPEVGSLDDVAQLIRRAHDRGIRVIIDFVMNHTSDQHPWFQASRRDPDGPYGDFYVWRDAPNDYLDARVIFVDTHDSNWAWDAVRGQFYWHRFFDHQPDLNWENPRVAEAMFDALRFWLDMGVDGFRLDAVPYLVEQRGTDCENLPGTHHILKQVRRIVDEEYTGRVLLCEANQWPEDVVEYVGDGDECHMAFHFPVMPRLFMALTQQRRDSVSEILAQTPDIPPGCQWATFLRNHDELTLEMVTLDDREYMWANYAPEPRMRCNIGIRRRLAPLLDGDQAKIRLLHSLLLSLPGSPVLYYGDEIGMGDNIWLPDRDGQRTPMQWHDGPGAGFSEGPAEHFAQPVVENPRCGPHAVNVRDQMQRADSLLVWLRSMLRVRRHHPVFGSGSFTDLGGGNPAVFAYLRDDADEAVLCVANFSEHDQDAEVVLPGRAGQVADNLLAADDPTSVGSDATLRVHLGKNGFAWFALRDDPSNPHREG